MASLNVPYANDVPVLTPVEAIGQWQQINHQKTMEDLAQQQERRLGQQAEREQKSGDLKYQMDAHNALKQVMTDFKSSLERRAKELKLSPDSPEYQQLANAMYSNNYDKTVFNITGKQHDPKTNIDLNAVNSLVDMTPTEKLDYELQSKKAELDLMQPYKLEIAQAQAGIDQASQQRQFQQQMQMAQLQNQFANQRDDRNFQQQYARDLQNRSWKIEDFEKETEAKRQLQKDLYSMKSSQPKPMSEYQQAQLDDKREQRKLATQGQLQTFDTMLMTLDRIKNHSGLESAVGKSSYIPSIRGSDAYNFEQSLETLKSQAFVPMVASLKGMGALSDAEGKKLTQAIGELDKGMSEDEFKKSVDRIISDIEAAKRRLESSSVLQTANSHQPQTQEIPQEVPAGYRLLRNKRTGETKLVKE